MTPDTEFADTFSGGDRAAFVYRHMVSFQETNLVGNVYFAHLAAWQGRCRELFLMRHAPEVLTDLTKDFKMVTTSLRIDYVLELFAFDEVEIRMRLAALNGHKISMDFELPEEQRTFRDMVRRWVDAEVPKSWARELERNEHEYPVALWKKFTDCNQS